jgi:molecular chaperone Hsp33
MFPDYLFYGSDVETRYAFRMVKLSDLAEFAKQSHNLNSERACLLGQTMVANALLASVLDDEERVNIRVQSESNFTIASECTLDFQMRAYFAAENTNLTNLLDSGKMPQSHFAVRSVRAKVGDGKLFEGITHHPNTTVIEALYGHFDQSYQMKTRFLIDCWQNHEGKMEAFGVVYLQLPNLEDAVEAELGIHVEAMPSLRKLYEHSNDPDFLATSLIPHKLRPINSKKPAWNCTCSQESVEGMLTTLSPADKADMLLKNEELTINCHYCNTDYKVSQARQHDLFANIQIGLQPLQ